MRNLFYQLQPNDKHTTARETVTKERRRERKKILSQAQCVMNTWTEGGGGRRQAKEMLALARSVSVTEHMIFDLLLFFFVVWFAFFSIVSMCVWLCAYILSMYFCLLRAGTDGKKMPFLWGLINKNDLIKHLPTSFNTDLLMKLPVGRSFFGFLLFFPRFFIVSLFRVDRWCEQYDFHVDFSSFVYPWPFPSNCRLPPMGFALDARRPAHNGL